MATRRKPDETLLDEDGNVIEFGLSITEDEREKESDEQALINVLEQLGADADGAKVMVYRITDDKRKPDAFLRRFTPAEFACDGLETLLRLYGGGLYKISVYGSNGRLIKNPTISIEAPAGYKPEGEQKPDDNRNSDDITARVTQSVTVAIAPVLQEIARAVSQPKENRSDFLQEMIQMRAIFSPPQETQTPGLGMMDMFQLFKEGIEFGKAAGPKGESNENDVLMGLLDRFGAPIAQAVLQGNKMQSPENQFQQFQPPPIPQMPQPAENNTPEIDNVVIPGTQNNQTENNQTKNENDPMFIIKQAVGFLVSQAARNADVNIYADMVADQLDDDALNAIINDPNWLETIARYNAKVREHAEWFERLHASLREILTPEQEQVENETPPVSGHENAAT